MSWLVKNSALSILSQSNSCHLSLALWGYNTAFSHNKDTCFQSFQQTTCVTVSRYYNIWIAWTKSKGTQIDVFTFPYLFSLWEGIASLACVWAAQDGNGVWRALLFPADAWFKIYSCCFCHIVGLNLQACSQWAPTSKFKSEFTPTESEHCFIQR